MPKLWIINQFSNTKVGHEQIAKTLNAQRVLPMENDHFHEDRPHMLTSFLKID